MPPQDQSLSLESDSRSRTSLPIVPAAATSTMAAASVEETGGMVQQALEANMETQTQSESQLWTQTQEFDDESSSQLSPIPPLSPVPIVPWGRFLPCSELSKVFELIPRPPVRPQGTTKPYPKSNNTINVQGISVPIHSSDTFNEHWFGRSNACDFTATAKLPSNSASHDNKRKEREANIYLWAHSMISNRHCRIYCVANPTTPKDNAFQVYIENHSGNGTLINQTILLKKGEKRLLHSGDEICLVNQKALRKKIRSSRFLQPLLQNYSYVFVNVLNRQPNMLPSHGQKRKACVNPRAMNYKRPPPSHAVPRQPRQSTHSSLRRIEVEYDIREILGDGTSGQVRRAIHRKTGEQCAVKVVPLRRNRLVVDTAQMEEEANILRSMDHPYIVNLVDVFISPGVAMYLVMELVHGGDLFDRIVEKQQYSQVESRRVMRRLLSAVYYLHEKRNIVHRDLKPENILCVHSDNPIEVKLTDFGLAKILNEEDGLKTFCGTPQYFAPEVLQRRNTVAGRGRYGKPADMWSLGVILYILLTGRPPFSPLEQSVKVEFSEQNWKDMPEAKDLVQKLLREDPKRRLSVRQACDHDWILMDDGDTHIHPFDDPSLTTCKRLFSSPAWVKQQGQAKPSTSGDCTVQKPPQSSSGTAGDDTSSTASTISKDDTVANNSVLSKEDFAKSAVAEDSIQQAGSLFQNAIGERSNSVVRTDSQESPVLKSQNVDNNVLQNESEESNEQEKSSNVNVRGDATVMHPIACDQIIPVVPTDGTTSPEPCKNLKGQQRETIAKSAEKTSSVTPSDSDYDTPLGPKSTTLSLNKRSNLFRERVLVKVNTDSQKTGISDEQDRESTLQSRKRKISPLQTDGHNVPPVTPKTSNAVGTPRLNPDAGNDEQMELPEDEILSQFSSSAAESMSSFGSVCGRRRKDPSQPSLDAGHDVPSRKKRRTEQQLDSEEQPLCSKTQTTKAAVENHKKIKTNGGRQTTLLSWFVKSSVSPTSRGSELREPTTAATT